MSVVLTFIIIFVISGILGGKLFSESKKSGMVVGACIGIMIYLIGSIFVLIFTSGERYIKDNKVEIVLPSKSASLLQIAEFEGNRYYVFFCRIPDGPGRFGIVPVARADVYEEDRINADIVVVRKETTYNEWIWNFLPRTFWIGTFDFPSYAIHVPKGTIAIAEKYKVYPRE